MANQEQPLVGVGAAPNRIIGEMWQEFLQQEGIPTFLRSSDGVAYLGASAPCTLMTTADRADHARALLDSLTQEDEAEADSDAGES